MVTKKTQTNWGSRPRPLFSCPLPQRIFLKVWFQINEAIRQHNIPQLSGAPGTGKRFVPFIYGFNCHAQENLCFSFPCSGKSQHVGDLATRLAKCCYTIHLNQNFSMTVMTRFLRGVCESNLWGFMENINLLTRSVMSVISSHFQVG